MWRAMWNTWAPFAGMSVAILAQSSSMVFIKFALSGGMDKFVFVLYCNCLSTAILFFPCLLILRRSDSPPLTSGTLLKFFYMALSGFLAQVFMFVGIDYSSATLGSALLNLVPAFTFILSVILRMEKLIWKSTSSQAKVAGTIVSVAGAFVVTLYKGPPITFSSSIRLLGSPSSSNWVLGGFFLAASAFLIGSCYIIQAVITRDYSVLMAIMFFYNLFLAFLAAMLSLFTVRDPKAWAVDGSGVLAIVYTTVMTSLIQIGASMWCVKKRGPLYVAMFQPLGIIFAVVLGVIFIGDQLHLGSLIGAAVIVGGFYGVMWGKAKEDNAGEPSGTLPQTSPKTPLLARQQC